MKNIGLNIEKALGTVSKEQVNALAPKAMESIATLENGTGAGNDFLGWLHLPTAISEAELAEIEETANVLRARCEVVVAVGVSEDEKRKIERIISTCTTEFLPQVQPF